MGEYCPCLITFCLVLISFTFNFHFVPFDPQLGYYRKSSLLQILKDTSNRAAQAVHDLTVEGGTLTNFRYQARLGVGKHTTQFTFLMLPFYTDLKVWFYFVSLLVGLIFGQLFLLIVYKCRIRFRKNRGRVAIGASITLSIVSAFVFSGGMYIIDYVWVRFVPSVSTYPCYALLWFLMLSFLFAAMGLYVRHQSSLCGILFWVVGTVSDISGCTILRSEIFII